MTTYLVVKWLHILSSVVLVGTGFGSAYYFFFINRSGDVESVPQHMARPEAMLAAEGKPVKASRAKPPAAKSPRKPGTR